MIWWDTTPQSKKQSHHILQGGIPTTWWRCEARQLSRRPQKLFGTLNVNVAHSAIAHPGGGWVFALLEVETCSWFEAYHGTFSQALVPVVVLPINVISCNMLQSLQDCFLVWCVCQFWRVSPREVAKGCKYAKVGKTCNSEDFAIWRTLGRCWN